MYLRLLELFFLFKFHLFYLFLINFCSIRVFLACFLQCCGFLLVAFANSDWMAISGVVLTSASSGIGEASFLAYSSKFNK